MLRTQGKNSLVGYIAYLATVPLLFLIGVRSTSYVAGIVVVLLVQIGVCTYSMRRDEIPTRRVYWLLGRRR
jgi:hypothetical protein